MSERICIPSNEIRRAIRNLVENSVRYGFSANVRLLTEPDYYVTLIEDDGPGIPPQMYEEAFRPFSRLDASRNQNVSGVGLGLTIARDTARAHGGDVTLGKSDLGGLKATIRLPFDVDLKGRSREQRED